MSFRPRGAYPTVMRRALPVAAGTAALALVAAAPGSSSPADPAAAGAAGAAGAAAPVEVVMRNNKFRPRRVVVPLGRAVRWTNRDKVPHTVVSRDGRIHSAAVRGGQTFRYRPPRRGRIRYFCTIHADQNGVLIVR
jgi:plastocyanin